jgi:hypothetical protein
MAQWNPNNPHYYRPLTPGDMESLEDDIDPATFEVFRTILESKTGQVWLRNFVVKCVAESHVIIRTNVDGRHTGYIKSYNIPEWAEKFPEIPIIRIKPEDSWLKKWIKRQLM